MKKLLTALVVFVYFVPASMIMSFNNNLPPLASVLIIPLVLMLAVCALASANIVGAAVSVLRSRCLSFRCVMLFKLCLIPFYLFNFACWAIGSMILHTAFLVWPIVPFVVAYTYFTMLGTSAHVIAKLFVLWRGKAITKNQLIIHSILQFIFAMDVFDSIYLAIKQKKLEGTFETKEALYCPDDGLSQNKEEMPK